MATTAPLKCPLKGHLTGLAHYQSIENAFKAGFMAAVERAAAGVSLTEDMLTEILERENLWLHDPRSENGLKEVTLTRTGSRGRPRSSGSGGNGDPASKSRGGNNKDYANKAFDPECCARRHWNGGICSDDGTQAGAQCTNKPDGEGMFCEKCEKRYQKSLNGEVEWHGSFAKSIQDDPGSKKDGSSHPWKTPKVSGEEKKTKRSKKTKDDGAGTGLEKTDSKKKKKTKKIKKNKKDPVEEPKEEEPKVEEDPVEGPKAEPKEEEPKKEPKVEEDPVKGPKVEPKVEEDPVKGPKAEPKEEPKVEEEPKEEPKVEESLGEDNTELIEVDGTQYIHDKESDTIYTKNGEPVGNWVDGAPVWDKDETEDMSDESDESDEEDEDSDSEE